MSKYVPRWLRGETPSAPASSPALAPTESHRVFAPLVNTSLPAKQAPALVPATLASLTTPLAPIKNKKPIPTAEDDFPTLGKPKVVAPVVTNFAALSRDWAAKQKEEAERLQNEKELAIHSHKAKLSEWEKEQRDEQALRRLGAISLPSSKKEEEPYVDPYRVEHSDESDIPMEEEEEEEEELDDDWDNRKHHGDLY